MNSSTAQQHYDAHLGNFYDWMIGNFDEKALEQRVYFLEKNIVPLENKLAIDLGAGNGLQAIPLAQLGFVVKAVDFNKQLTDQLESMKDGLPIEIIYGDMLDLDNYCSL